MRRAIPSLVLVVALALTACAPGSESPPGPSGTPELATDGVQPAGHPRELASGLVTPWSVVRLPDGTVLVSERDTARIVRIDDGEVAPVGEIAGVVPGGEGGLLGIAALDDGATRWLYAYLTAEGDNRIVRLPLIGGGAALELGVPEVVLGGIPKAGNHNGGRIAFGPDGMLYATTGDAGIPDASQDPASVAGKILRLTPDGAVPDDNPSAGSLVYSLGHRNPQGLAWDDDGQLWAAEFGQNTWDEFNRIEPGGNYGWPVVEGIAGEGGFIDPVAQWSTSEASPSGLAFVDGTFFLAALRGERVWAIYPVAFGQDWAEASEASGVSWFEGEFGRIRDVAAGPDGSLWFLTQNTDGRGSPRDGDDRLYEVRLAPLVEG